MRRKIFKTSVVLYVLSFIMLYVSLFCFFRTFLNIWFVLTLFFCALTGILALTVAFSQDFSYNDPDLSENTNNKYVYDSYDDEEEDDDYIWDDEDDVLELEEYNLNEVRYDDWQMPQQTKKAKEDIKIEILNPYVDEDGEEIPSFANPVEEENKPTIGQLENSLDEIEVIKINVEDEPDVEPQSFEELVYATHDKSRKSSIEAYNKYMNILNSPRDSADLENEDTLELNLEDLIKYSEKEDNEEYTQELLDTTELEQSVFTELEHPVIVEDTISEQESLVKETEKDIMATLDNAISFNDTNDVSITKAPEEIESEPIVHNGTDAMDELRRLAKQKRSKEDIVKKWKVINPFGTQKQCARDLNISLKTVKKWW